MRWGSARPTTVNSAGGGLLDQAVAVDTPSRVKSTKAWGIDDVGYRRELVRRAGGSAAQVPAGAR